MACGDILLWKHDKGCGGFVITKETCKSRWCAPCSAKLAGRYGRAIRDGLKKFERCSFITLTIRNMASLSAMRDKAYRALRRLLRHKDFRRWFPRGYWSLGLTYNHSAGDWHVHFHLAVQAECFVHYSKLQAVWARCLGEYGSIQIGAVRSAYGVSRELSRGTKGDWRRLREAARSSIAFRDVVDGALSSRRLFGAWGGLRLTTTRSGCLCPHCRAVFKYSEWICMKPRPGASLDGWIPDGAKVDTVFWPIEYGEPP